VPVEGGGQHKVGCPDSRWREVPDATGRAARSGRRSARAMRIDRWRIRVPGGADCIQL
jgi:hypothetical protein